MNREQALDLLCQKSIFIIPLWQAREIAAALGQDVDQIGVTIAPAAELARDSLSPRYPGLQSKAVIQVQQKHAADRGVLCYSLAVRVALAFGLYGGIDHAMQSPYHTAQAECRYIACRAAIRLARMFAGPQGVLDLRERNPWMDAKLFAEVPFTGTGAVLEQSKDEKRKARRL